MKVPVKTLILSVLLASCMNDNVDYEQKAFDAIKQSFGTEQQEYGVNLFISHHLEELSREYWLNLTGTDEPDPHEILDKLVIIDKWEDEDSVNLDFSLPSEITQYVISVSLDKAGRIVSINMES
jgi:hypothetical protein